MTHLAQELAVVCLALAPVVASAQDPRSEPSWRTLRETMEVERAERTGERPQIGEPPCLPVDPSRVHATRHLTLYQDPKDKVQEVHVAGGVATIIRLPSNLAARGTRILAGGRRFQLLMGGNQILITPTRQLTDGERFPMDVALADGTVIHLSLTPAPKHRWADGEVWLDREQANPEELRSRLADVEAKALGFEASLHKAQKEQESRDFALAGMMATGQSELVAFDKARERTLIASPSRRIDLTTYAPRPDAESATSKVVAVFEVTNDGSEPLNLSSGRALRKPDAESGMLDVPFALRALPTVIPPGGMGQIVVVLDRASFGSGGIITLSFFDSPLIAGIQFSTDLSIEDFTVPTKSKWWWIF